MVDWSWLKWHWMTAFVAFCSSSGNPFLKCTAHQQSILLYGFIVCDPIWRFQSNLKRGHSAYNIYLFPVFYCSNLTVFIRPRYKICMPVKLSLSLPKRLQPLPEMFMWFADDPAIDKQLNPGNKVCFFDIHINKRVPTRTNDLNAQLTLGEFYGWVCNK